jgi:hypothetical protein
MRFVAPSAQSTWQVHLTRVCLTRYVPPTGFRTPLTACSSPDYPALFHAGALMEFQPFRAFPSPGAVAPLGVRCPPAVGRLRMPHEPAGPTATPCPTTRHDNPTRESNRRPFTAISQPTKPARLQGLAPRDESVAPPRRLGRRRARCSPGLRTWSGLPSRSRVPTQATARLPRACTGGAAKGTRRTQTRTGQLAPRRIDSSEVGDVSGTPHRPRPGDLPHRRPPR